MAEASPSLEALARQYVRWRIREYILAQGRPVKVGEMSRELGTAWQLSPRLIRQELQQSGETVPVERFWDLKWHHEEKARSLDGALRTLLRQHGMPLRLSLLVQEAARWRRRAYEVAWEIASRLLRSRPQTYVFLNPEDPDPWVALREWLLEVPPGDEAEQREKMLWRLGKVETALKALKWPSNWKSLPPVELAVRVIERSEGVVDHRLLAFAIWQRKGEEYEPLALFRGLWEHPKVHGLSGPVWVSEALYQRIQQEVQRLSEAAEGEGPGLPVAMVVQELLQRPVEARARLRISEEDLLQVYLALQRAPEGRSILDLVSEVLEFFPGDEEFVPALQSLHQAMMGDPRFTLVGADRWFLTSSLPVALHTLLPTLQPSQIVVSDPLGGPVDAELADEGLEGSLDLEVHAPDLEDVGEEHEVGELAASVRLTQRVRYVTLLRHYREGTLKVRKIDQGIFPPELADITPLLLILPNGETYSAWFTPKFSLVVGLERFYADHLPPSGGIFFVESRGEWEGHQWVLHVLVEKRVDPLLYIPPERLSFLEQLQTIWEMDPTISVLRIMQRIMEDYPQGVPFRRLYAEVNVVRRVTKRLVASNLSSYPCFSLHPQDPSLWLYDPAKAEARRSLAKQRFIL